MQRRSQARYVSTLRLLLLVAPVSFIAIVGNHAATAATYYVASTGSDTNSGSQSAPFRQIRQALTVVKPGDNVLVGNGAYLGFDVFNINGTASSPITISANGSHVVINPTTDRSDNRDTIFVSYSSYVCLRGLRSFNANRAAVRVDNSPHITVSGGTFGNNAEWGIFTDFSDELLLEYNECYGSVGQHGIYVSNSCVNPVVRNNVLHDNSGCGLQLNADLSQGPPGIITGAVIENNIIYNNGASGGAGINLDGVHGSEVINNLLYNNLATGIALFQIDGASGPRGDLVANNTIDMPSGSRWAVEINSSDGENTVRNNILINRGSYRGGIEYDTATDVADTDSDYNVVDKITTDGSNTVLTLAQWQAMGHELHSIPVDLSTLFVDLATGNYHLAAGSPAIQRGQTLPQVTRDLAGTPRPKGVAPDIGCYEYVP